MNSGLVSVPLVWDDGGAVCVFMCVSSGHILSLGFVDESRSTGAQVLTSVDL